MHSYLAGALAIITHQFFTATWANRLGEVVTFTGVLVKKRTRFTLWGTAILKEKKSYVVIQMLIWLQEYVVIPEPGVSPSGVGAPPVCLRPLPQ